MQTSSVTGSFPEVVSQPLSIFSVDAVPDSTQSSQACVNFPETTDVWDTPFAVLDMAGTVKLADEIVQARKPEYFVTANLNYLMLIEQFPKLVDVNRHAAAVLADGQPIVVRSRFGTSRLPARVAGSDLIVELARLSAARGYRMFFLGAAEGIASAAATALKLQFPQLQIAGCYSPPFRQWNEADRNEIIAQVQSAKTDILLVAFGQPKGELWIDQNLHQLNVPLSIQLGASFDFVAGTAQRAPEVWQRYGCEWLYRMLKDPKRLVPRYSANAWYLLRRIYRDLASLLS